MTPTRDTLRRLSTYLACVIVLLSSWLGGIGPASQWPWGPAVVPAFILVVLLLLRLFLMRGIEPSFRRPEILWVTLIGVFTAALLLFFPLAQQGQLEFDVKLDLILAVWQAIVGGVVVLLFVLERTASRMRIAGSLDWPRCQRALLSTLNAWLGLTAVGVLTFASVRHDVRADVVMAPSSSLTPATVSLLEAAGRRVEVIFFAERKSPMVTMIADYLAALQTHGVDVSRMDQADDPDLARELKVSRNGTLVVRSGERSEKWFIGTDPNTARKNLRQLDEQVRRRIMKLSRPEQVVYFTTGHGERSTTRAKEGERPSGYRLRKLIEAVNASVKSLGIAEGLARDIPLDANLVVVHGPEEAWVESEIQALRTYVERGGALLLLLDPGGATAFESLLAALGVSLSAERLVNEDEFIPIARSLSDRAFLFATTFGNHPSVRSLREAKGKAAVLFQDVGALTRRADTSTNKSTITIRSRPSTFVDMVPNFRFDPEHEIRNVVDIAAAIEGSSDETTNFRVMVIADSDVFADSLLKHDGNAAFAYESVLWLLRDDDVRGNFDEKNDAPLRHTHREERLWFFGAVFFSPGVVLIAGMWHLRRRRLRGVVS